MVEGDTPYEILVPFEYECTLLGLVVPDTHSKIVTA
jgi:hypothetical protein